MKRTEDLIAELAADDAPVPRFPRPTGMFGCWLVVAVVAITLFVALMGARADLAARLADARFVIDIALALATGLGAAWAAIMSALPGRPRWQRLLPLIPTLLWLVSLVYGALPDKAPFQPDFVCLPLIAAMAALPSLVLVLVMRRGYVLSPCFGMFLAVGASASVAYIGLRFVHMEEAGRMIFVWQFGSVALVSLMASCFGGHLFRHGASLKPNDARSGP